MKNLKSNADGDLVDEALVEIGIVGPIWSPLMRFRVYMKGEPENHLTIWKLYRLSTYIGSYTPPAWMLKLLGQIKEDPSPYTLKEEKEKVDETDNQNQRVADRSLDVRMFLKQFTRRRSPPGDGRTRARTWKPWESRRARRSEPE